MQTVNIWTQSPFPDLTDYVIMGVYLIIIFIWAYHTQQRKVKENPAYKYFTLALFAKILGAIALCLIYTLYYSLQDTLGFYISSEALVNVFFENPKGYFRLLFEGINPETYSAFSIKTSYPWYYNAPASFFVVRLTSLFTFFGFNNYFTTSILFSSFFFIGYWKLYLLFTSFYPKYSKEFAIAVFFYPSVLFWGSGILKDTICLSMTGWFLFSAHNLILRKNIFWNLIKMIISGYLVIAIKPYILVGLLPGLFIWQGWSYLRRFENIALRLILAPIALVIFLGIALVIYNVLSPALGDYGSLEEIIKKAIVTYEDHTTAARYGDNFYYLGEFDGTIGNFFAKAPLAILTGLFRPFVWESKNFFMFLAAFENLILIFLVGVTLWRVGFVKTIKIAFDEPLVIFSISFAIIFAFAIGISTANFGALVRLKTPLLPFLAVALIILFKRSQDERRLT